MAKGLNKVILIGNLGSDPEVRYMPSGGAVANLKLATSESWKDKQTGQQQERTEWHTVVLYNRLAEVAGEYLKKGSKAYIEGSLRTRKWQDKNGQDRYSTEVVGVEMQMLDSKNISGERTKAQPEKDMEYSNQKTMPYSSLPAGYDPLKPDESDDIPF